MGGSFQEAELALPIPELGWIELLELTSEMEAGKGQVGKLKNLLNDAAVRELGRTIRSLAGVDFNSRGFLAATLPALDGAELFARAEVIASALRRNLSLGFEASAAVLVATVGPPRTTAGYGPPSAYRVLPLTRFVSMHGLNEPEVSLAALRELTRRFTAEFDVRPFIRAHPELCQRMFRDWVRDDDQHVRRLVSEGTRPRLPWASHLTCFKRDPGPVLDLLEKLKDDSSAYVRRSVANNLADILKDNPQIGRETLARWSRSPPHSRREMLRHATRYWRRKEEAWAVEFDKQLSATG